MKRTMLFSSLALAILLGASALFAALQQPAAPPRFIKNAKGPVVRISKGRFAPERYEVVNKLIEDSAAPLVPPVQQLQGLLYYHASVDHATNTVVNVSIWESLDAAKQMDTLQPMLAQCPLLEAAGVQFDKIANYEPLWKIEGRWSFAADQPRH